MAALTMLPESPMNEPLECVKIISRRHSVILHKSNTACELEIKNAQLEWQLHKLSNEYAEMSAELRNARKAQSSLEAANVVIANQGDIIAVHETEIKKLQRINCELEGHLEQSKLSSTKYIDDLEQRLNDTKTQAATEKQQLMVQFNAQIDHLESQLHESQIALKESNAQKEQLQEEKSAVETRYEDYKASVMSLHQGGSEHMQSSVQYVRSLQERNVDLVGELRRVSSTVADLEKTIRLKEEECAVANRVRLRVESSLEALQHETALLEESKKKIAGELSVSLGECDKLLRSKREMESALHDYSIRHADLIAANGTLRERLEAMEVEQEKQKTGVQRMEDLELRLQKEVHTNEVLASQLAKTKGELVRAVAASAELEHSLADSRSALAAAYKEVAAYKGALSAKVESLQAQHAVEVEELHASFEAEREDYEDQLGTLSQAFEKRGALLRDLEKKVNVQSSEISFLKPELARKEKRIGELDLELRACKKENEELIRMASQSDSRGAIINDLKADLSDKTKLQEDLRTAMESMTVARTTVETLQREFKHVRNEYDNLQEKFAEAQATIEELSSTAAEEIDNQQLQITQLKESLEQKSSSLVTASRKLQELSALYDGLLHKHSELVDEKADMLEGKL